MNSWPTFASKVRSLCAKLALKWRNKNLTNPTGLQLKIAGDACLTCPARNGVCVPSEINKESSLTFVGEAPGYTEKEQGKPFIGKSGRMLDRGLKTIGLKRENASWTNAVLCGCDEDDLNVARKHCEKRLIVELTQAASPIIIPTGKYALQSTLGLSKAPQIIGKKGYRGTVTRKEFTPAYSPLVCPTIHPAAVLRNTDANKRAYSYLLELDVKRIGKLLSADPVSWLPPESRPGHTLHIISDTSGDSLENLLESLGSEISFDVETTFDSATKNRLLCFGISDGKTTIVIQWATKVNGLESNWSDPTRDFIRRCVNRCFASRLVVTHNGPAFDHVVAQRFGLKIDRWEDTLLQTHSLHSHLKKGLNHVVSMYLDAPAWKEVPHTEDMEKLMFYNGQDALYTILCFFALRDEMRQAV